MICCHPLEVLNNLRTRGPTFPFCTRSRKWRRLSFLTVNGKVWPWERVYLGLFGSHGIIESNALLWIATKFYANVTVTHLFVYRHEYSVSCGWETWFSCPGLLRTLKSLSQLPHPSPLDAACFKMERHWELYLAQVLATPCPFTWNADSPESSLLPWLPGPRMFFSGFPPACLFPQTVLSASVFLVFDEEGHTLSSQQSPWRPRPTELSPLPPCVSHTLHSKLFSKTFHMVSSQ